MMTSIPFKVPRCTALILVFICAAVASRLDDFSWSHPKLPDVSPAAEIVKGKAKFGGHVHSRLRVNCDLTCQTEKDERVLSLVDIENDLSFETLEVSNTTRIATYLNVSNVPAEMLRLDTGASNSSVDEETNLPLRKRRKRSIFGFDTRHTLSTERFSTLYPFSTAVKISTGCAGILVSPKHVLTSAHCIHNGKKYLKGVKKLRVGRYYERKVKKKKSKKAKKLKKMKKLRQKAKRTSKKKQKRLRRSKRGVKAKRPPKFRWVRAVRTRIPQAWLQPRGRRNANVMVEFDYAIIELKKSLSNDFMRLGISPIKEQLPNRGRLHLTAFDQGKPKKLLYRHCMVEEQTTEMMYHFCDALKGTSGAGMYIRLFDQDARRWDRRIIGVFSGHQWVDMGKGLPPKEYNTGVRITPLKFAQICFWVTGDYSQCREG